MDKLYIVMPAYNEEENIREVVRSWYACLEGKDAGSRLVVADSGSSDLTHKYLKSMQREMPQ
ncbi:MAG: glycosyltransferase, partial [Lachnospiraceae bacterium]|nr:glycosyltransferase [Lachnospiraceae bacterium]